MLSSDSWLRWQVWANLEQFHVLLLWEGKIRSRLPCLSFFNRFTNIIHRGTWTVWKPGDESGRLRVTLSCRLVPHSQHLLGGKSWHLFSLFAANLQIFTRVLGGKPSLPKALSHLLMGNKLLLSSTIKKKKKKLSSCFYHAVFSLHVTNHPLLFSNIKEYIWNWLLRVLEDALRVLVCTHYLNKFMGLMGRNYRVIVWCQTFLNINFRPVCQFLQTKP